MPGRPIQATLVALYGKKPEKLQTFLTDCQNAVAEMLGSRFRRYDVRQIHGTVVGLERDAARPGGFLNRNFRTHRGEEQSMDFGGLLDFLRNGGHVPFQLQIGGFQDRDYPFTSRSARPFDRSFSIQGRNVVVIGWPVRGQPLTDAPSPPITSIEEAKRYPDTMDAIRRGAQSHGVLHAYHGKPEDTDNDFFFRIGRVDDPSSVDSFLKTRVQDALRSFLGASPPLILDVSWSDLQVVFYESEELPPASSIAYSLDRGDLDDGLIRDTF